ncbi:hypothetical protein OF83DRAFT_656740 [Amylostereum chailletii]|nr:hypothetical protein OF83DRAFT_656740 [Amylostereum chailletii]
MLALQCDRKVPCKACLDRGCTNLCTGGMSCALVALMSIGVIRFILMRSLPPPGSRRIALMNTEQLRTNVMLMSDRIQLLEQALEASHSKQSSHPHPLLIPELLGIKLTTDEVPTNVHLSMPSYTTVPSTEAPSSEDPNRSLAANRVSPDRSLYGEMVSLSEEWKNPVAGSSSHQNSRAHMKRCIHNLLPLRQGAQYLCNMAKDLAFWHHNPVPCETYLPVLVDDVYDTPPEAICPYRMASLFAVMAIGSHVSDNAPSAIQVGLLYHRLARVLLCEMSHGNTRPTAVDALIALFFMTLYLLMFYDEKEQLNLAGDILSISTQVSNQNGINNWGNACHWRGRNADFSSGNWSVWMPNCP